MPPWEPLIRRIGERNPELAERLRHLRDRAPERFDDVIAEALMMRLEDVLADLERESAGPAQPRPLRARSRLGAPEPRSPGPPPPPERDERVAGLQRRHEELEMHSHGLARELRRPRAEGDDGAERDRLRAEIERAVNEQFGVRTELRRLDLERIERELQALQRAIDRLRTELESRERERPAIIERRIRDLLGDDKTGW